MPGTDRDDMGMERPAEQQDVADDIQNLVTNKFVGKAERLFRDDLVPLQNDGAIETPTLDLAHLDQLLDILIDRERPGRRDLGRVDFRIDRDRKVLGMDAAIVGRGAGDLQLIGRQGDERRIAARDRNRLLEFEIFTILVLLDRFALDDEIHVWPGRAVHDRRFARIHLDHHIVDRIPVQRTEHMLHRMDLGMARRDGGAPHQVGNLTDMRPYFGRPVQIDPPKNNPMVDRGRLHGQRDIIPGMECRPLQSNFTQ